jgi:hypothetical protein
VFISHGDCREDVRYLEQLLKEKYGVKEILDGCYRVVSFDASAAGGQQRRGTHY